MLKQFKIKADVNTERSLVHVCVFALMYLKWHVLPTSFVLRRAELGFQKGLCTHTHTHKYIGVHTPTQCTWSQLAGKCLDTLCVLTPLASEHLLSIRVADRQVTLRRRHSEIEREESDGKEVQTLDFL